MRKNSTIVILIIGLVTASLGNAQEVSKQLTLPQKRQLFVEGVKLFQEKQYEQAVQNFEQLVNHYPELQEYVQFFLANTYINLKEQQKALVLLQQILSRYPSHPLADEVRLNAANLLLADAKYQEAITLYTMLLDRPEIDQGDIQYQLGRAFLGIGNDQDAVAAFHKVVSFYPSYPSVKEAKQELQKILEKDPKLTPQWTEETLLDHANALLNARIYKEAIAQYEAFKNQYPNSSQIEECEFGIVDAYFRSGNTKKGMSILEQLVTQYSTVQKEFAARALYTIAAKHWGADRDEQAKQYLQRIVKEYAQTSWGDKAYYVFGRIYQSENGYKEAADWYHKLYTTYPTSDLAEESLWRAGWSYYLNQQYDLAEQMFSQGGTAFPDGSYSDESLYWQGRAYEKRNNQQAAVKTYRQLIRVFTDSYYGILAQKRLRLLNVMVETEQKKPVKPTELSLLLQELRRVIQPKMYDEISLHVRKAIELHEVQLKKYAAKEADSIVSLYHDTSRTLSKEQDMSTGNLEQQLLFTYFLSQLYASIGEYLKSIQSVSEIETLLKQSGSQRLPYPLEISKYPLAFWEIIKKYAEQNSLDPFLVAAIIRQESAYEPDALSSAGAQGLMQIIPKTGKQVAQKVGLKNFAPSQLYDPEINILLGTKHVADLLEQYDGNLYRTLAAYNAGLQATGKWWTEKSMDDQEVIVENITYRATQNYVKQVIRSQHYYRTIYSGLLQSQ